MINSLDFAPRENNNSHNSPWDQSKVRIYEDLLLKPEYRKLVLTCPIGQTWIRIIPALGESRSWLLPLHVNNFPGGRFLHPRTLTPGAKSVFDLAYSWSKEHAPAGLYSRENRDGVRLLADPMALLWVLVEVEGKYSPRLLLQNGYDGTRGGTPGFGHKIWRLAHDRDEKGNLAEEIIDADTGVLVSIEKTQPPGAQYATYNLRAGRQPKPLADLLATIDSSELARIAPLEQIVQETTEAEQWARLEMVIAPDTVALIRRSLGQ